MLKISITSRANTKLNRSLDNLVSDLMTAFTQEAKNSTPSRTGRARRGWRKLGSGRRSISQNNVPYIEYLDKGTDRMRAANGGKGIVKHAINNIKKRN